MPDPPSLLANVAAGGTLQQPFDLLNGGPVDGAWSARIGGDPALQTPVPVSQTTSPDAVANTSFGCFNPGTGFLAGEPLPARVPAIGHRAARRHAPGFGHQLRDRFGEFGQRLAGPGRAPARAGRSVDARQPRAARRNPGRDQRRAPAALPGHVRCADRGAGRPRAGGRTVRARWRRQRNQRLSRRQQRRRDRACVLGRARMRHRRTGFVARHGVRVGAPRDRTRAARVRSLRRLRDAGGLARGVAGQRQRSRRWRRDPRRDVHGRRARGRKTFGIDLLRLGWCPIRCCR